MTVFSDALLFGMKTAPLQLQKFVVRNHHREIGRELWREAIFAVQIQDSRLSDKERQVIAAIGFRLHGRRAVV